MPEFLVDESCFAQQPLGSLDQNSAVNEFDRTLATHCVQAYGDAFAGGTNYGSNFPVRQRNIDQHAIRFAHTVPIGEVRQQPVNARGNSVEGKISETLFCMLEALSDQTESVIVQPWIFGHR